MASNNITIDGKQYDAESLKALRDVLESARDTKLSLQEVAKMIEANQRLLQSYQTILKVVKSTEDSYRKQRKTLDEVVKYNKTVLDLTRAESNVRKNVNQTTSKTKQFLEEINDLSAEMVRNDIDSRKIKQEINRLESTRHKIINEQQIAQTKLKESYKDLSSMLTNPQLFPNIISQSLSKDLEESEKRYSKLLDKLDSAKSERSANTIRKKLAAESQVFSGIINEVLSESQGNPEVSKKINDILRSSNVLSSFKLQLNILDDVNEKYHQQYDFVKNIEDKMHGVDRILKSLSFTPLSAIFDFDEISAKLKDKISPTGENKSLARGLVESLAQGTQLGKLGAIGASIYALNKITDILVTADGRVTDLAKSFGVAKDEAGGIYDRMEGLSSAVLGINIDDLVQAQISYNEQLGYSINLSDDLLKTITRNKKLIGLTDESTKTLVDASLTSNTDASRIQKDILGTIVLQSKGLANNRVVLEKVLQTSSLVRANFKGNLTELAKATVEAQRLGTTLDDINQIGESLLNFESSISSELEAELLTGRQLNLERARYASLMGDTATLMNEVAKNVGNFDEFVNMNVIQQQSYASALGMTRKEMVDMLYQQKINAKLISVGNVRLNESQRSILSQSETFRSKFTSIMSDLTLSQEEKLSQLGNIAMENLSQLSAQQKFEETLIKVKEKIAQIFGDGAILDKLANGFVSVARKLNFISEEDQKRFIISDIVSKSGLSQGKTSSELANITSRFTPYSLEELQAKSDLLELDKMYGKNSQQYKSEYDKMMGEGKLNLFGESSATMRNVMGRIDDLIKTIKENKSQPNIYMNSVKLNEAQNKVRYPNN